MFNLIVRFIKFLLPILRTATIQVAADTLNDLAYSQPRRFGYMRPRTSYRQRPRGYTDTVRKPNPFPPGSPNHLRHQAGFPPIKKEPFHDVLMVAFDLTGPSAGIVHEWLQNQMPPPVSADFDGDVGLDSWWVANDERFDGSDCDSAIFVPKGKQSAAVAILKKEGFYE